MQDHSHKLMFMAATGLMSAAVLYGSQAAPALLGPDPGFRSAAMSLLTPVVFAPFTVEPRQPPPQHSSVEDGNTPGTSVLPNTASCPASAALVAPPTVGSSIGKDAPQLTKDASPPPSSGVVGTGGGCPRLGADTGKPPVAPLPGAAPSPASRTDIPTPRP